MNSIINGLKNNVDEESRKKIIKFGIIFAGIIFLIIIISIIFALINRKTSYENMETIMEEAAYKYYQNNLGQLPTLEVKTAIVSADTLVEQEYMKEISKYTKDESCTGNVIVTNYNGEYDYQGYLMCNDFVTSLLVDTIKKDNTVVSTGAGLYDESGILRFRGEQINNYLKLDKNIYRIIKIDNNNKIYIIPENMDDNDENLFVYWDDRYNSEEQMNCGINDYSISRIKDSLNNIYNNLNENIKSKTTTFTACISNRSSNEIINTGDIECSKTIENSNISLLPIYEYIKASIASACQNTDSKECKNYNYLYNEDYNWWTNTGDSTNTDRIYAINYSGEIEKERGNNKKMARYVLALKDNVLWKNGNGSKNNPYTVR